MLGVDWVTRRHVVLVIVPTVRRTRAPRTRDAGAPGEASASVTPEEVISCPAAVEDAHAVTGVDAVYDELDLRPFPHDPHDDEMRGAALQALIRDPASTRPRSTWRWPIAGSPSRER